MGIFKTILYESTDEVYKLFTHHIDAYWEKGNMTKVKELRDKLRRKTGKDYDPSMAQATDDEKIENVSINSYYTKDDFRSFAKYEKWANELFRLKFSEYSKHLVNKYGYKVSINDAAEKMGIPVKFSSFSGQTFVMRIAGRVLEVNASSDAFSGDLAPVETLVHEFAHVVEEELGLDKKFDELQSYQHGNKSSNYDLSPSEIWAENFKHFFLEPKYLKAGWANVYEEIDKIVPAKYKKIVQAIMSTKAARG